MAEIQEARFATDDLEATDTGVSHVRLKAGKRQPFGHKHDEAEEVYVVIAGKGRSSSTTRSSSSRRSMRSASRPGDARIRGRGRNDLELLAFGRRHEGDGEIFQGWWAPTRFLQDTAQRARDDDVLARSHDRDAHA